MKQIIGQLDFQVACADYVELDQSWNTGLFSPASRYVPYSRIYFPVSGQGKIEYNGKVIIAERGKIVLVPPCAKIFVSCDDHLEKYWLHFNAVMPDTGSDIFALLDEVISLPVSEADFAFTEKLFNIIRRKYRQFRSGSSGNPFEEQSANAALMLLLEPFLLQLGKVTDNPDFFRVLDVMVYLNLHLSKHITLKELGAHVNMHPNYFSALFKKQIGISPIAYLNQRRINRAMSELSQGTLRINEIAELTGAANPAAFSKMFRKFVGVSPREYRLAAARGEFVKSPREKQ